MFRVIIPASRPVERRHILKVILDEFLGLAYHIEEDVHAPGTRIEMDGGEAGRGVVVADELLAIPSKGWLSTKSLPKQPLATYTPPTSLGYSPGRSIPVMYAGTGQAGAPSEKEVRIDFDLFGSAFFLLTRYEEVTIDDRDRFGRFQAKDSAMLKAGVLDRPLVDEYTEILRRAIEVCWPGVAFKTREFKIVPTHDVDVPYNYLFLSPARAVRRSAARLILRRSWGEASNAWALWKKIRAGDDMADAHYAAMIRLMDLSEKAGLQSRFYFIAGQTTPGIDGDYDLDHPRIRRLLKLIQERGHQIGLHPSFGTLGRRELIQQEFKKLERICAEEKVFQNEWSVRSHYLRWETRFSFRDFDEVGFDFDSTLSFAEHAGFRCGTCHEFTTFDLTLGRALRLREQPLIAMEVSLLQPYHQGLSYEQAREYFDRLKERCRSARGQYVFLWHNSRFPSGRDWELYQRQLSKS
jgi:hypothetical protein